MGLGKSLKKIAKHTIAPVFSVPAKAIQKATGVDWKGQLSIGAGVGGLMSMFGRRGVPGAVGPGTGYEGPMSFDQYMASPTGGTGFNASGLLGPLLGVGGDIYSARQIAGGARDANSMSLQSARERMAFEERMSSTAHQREVADLQAAGLNPVLSAQHGGASTPSGDSIDAVNEAPDYRGVLPHAVSTAINLKRMEKEFQNIDANIGYTNSAAGNQKAQAGAAAAQRDLSKAEEEAVRVQTGQRAMDLGFDTRHPRQFAVKKFFQNMSPAFSSARDAAMTVAAMRFPGLFGGAKAGVKGVGLVKRGFERGYLRHLRRRDQ